MKKLLAKIVLFGFAFNVFAGFALAMYPPTTKIHDANLLVDGDMEASGTGAWTAANATLTKVAGGAKDGHSYLNVYRISGGSAGAYQSVVSIGKTYEIKGSYAGDSVAFPRIVANGQQLCIGTNSTLWQKIVNCKITITSGNSIGFSPNVDAHSAYFDDITVIEYSQTKIRDVSRSLTNFSGTSYVSLSQGVVATSTSAYIEFKATSTPSLLYTLFQLKNAEYPAGRHSCQITNFLKVTCAYYNGTSYVGYRVVDAIQLNKWYKLVYSNDGTTTKIYLNGVLQPSGGASANQSDSNTTFGSRGANGQSLDGNLKHPIIWNRILTDEESRLTSLGVFPKSGKVVEFGFNELTSTQYDLSGSGNNGVNNGTLSLSTDTPVDGFAGDSRNPTKISNVSRSLMDVSVGNVTISNFNSSSTVFSYNYWTKYTGAIGETDAQFYSTIDTRSIVRVNVENTTGKLFIWNIQADNTGALACKMSTGVPLNTWLNVGVVYDNGNNYLYVNGVLVCSGSSGKTPTSLNQFRLYTRYNSTSKKDTARFYNRAISSDEMMSIYKNIPVKNGMILEWLMNENSGTTAYDTSGQGNHGTISGSTYSVDVPNTP